MLEGIITTFIVVLAGVYVLNFNYSHFEPAENQNFNSINQWNYDKQLEVTEFNGVLKITSNNTVYASWPLLTSKSFNVYSGETILLSFYVKYLNTAQSSLGIMGNTSKGDAVLSYAFIVEGNSSWQYYSLRITIPSDVSSAFIQLAMGWVLYNKIPEIIMLKDIALYNLLSA